MACLIYLPSQARLALPPTRYSPHPETEPVALLFDCPDIPLAWDSAHDCASSSRPIRAQAGTRPPLRVTRDGVVYELFFTALPPVAFTAADYQSPLYLHRGAFETVLCDETRSQLLIAGSRTLTWGQECWQILSQWMWNLRLELGHHPRSDPLCARRNSLRPSPLAHPQDADEKDDPEASTGTEILAGAQLRAQRGHGGARR